MLDAIISSSYLPLIKFLKSTRDVRITANMPLSFLENLHKNGHLDLINDIKTLVAAERISLVGSAAYHPILPKISPANMERQIVLNEYALGYYFGKNRDFDGDDCLMIKNLNGFFPPELALDGGVFHTLGSLGYKWVLADEPALGPTTPNRWGVYGLDSSETLLVSRDRELSNKLAFKRDLDLDDLVDTLGKSSKNKQFLIIALDAETFGHHYAEGMILLESFVATAMSSGCEFVSVDQIVDVANTHPLDTITASSWGATSAEVMEGNIYPFWDDSANEIHRIQWELMGRLESVLEEYVRESEDNAEQSEDIASKLYSPLWLDADTAPGTDSREVLLRALRSMNSDQFWWASKKRIFGGKYLYSPEIVLRSLESYKRVAALLGDSDFENFVESSAARIDPLLKV